MNTAKGLQGSEWANGAAKTTFSEFVGKRRGHKV